MSIRKLPAVTERVETGVVQFGDDWPGVFIRGDAAFFLNIQLSGLVDLLSEANIHAREKENEALNEGTSD